ESYRAKQEDLENDMQLKFNTYTAMQTQLQQAKAKVQERTPAFTLLKGASVPIKPSGPKRMIFVIGMVILAFFGTIGWILKDELKKTV
ncbi:MAG: chain-length determining protein, partial [Prevotella sp.]|nr:chain-length determining protein [Prevotella sp.]